MRPPKQILIVGPEEQVSTLRYVLTTMGNYRVTVVESANEALACLRSPDYNIRAIVLFGGFFGTKAIIAKRSPRTQVMVILKRGECLTEPGADAVLCEPSSMTVLAQVKRISARKRGPLPGTPCPVQRDTFALMNEHQDQRIA
jgi:DNA-binding response OmpR family regulator